MKHRRQFRIFLHNKLIWIGNGNIVTRCICPHHKTIAVIRYCLYIRLRIMQIQAFAALYPAVFDDKQTHPVSVGYAIVGFNLRNKCRIKIGCRFAQHTARFYFQHTVRQNFQRLGIHRAVNSQASARQYANRCIVLGRACRNCYRCRYISADLRKHTSRKKQQQE
ncbi:hypothetical protein Barb7_02182 [Bacteroidales bacterium Barb7]|nr:hypothetical protein Barb7_02182 [Bacteroidales bacterium Barb7]